MVNKIFCAFCKIPRRIYQKKHANWTNVLLSICAAMMASLIIWQSIQPQLLILFVVFVAGSECFIQLRRRTSVRCPYCGFDPIVYKRDHKQASLLVKETLEQRRNAPDYLLTSKNPFVNLPKRKLNDPSLLPPSQRDKSSGRLMSKQI